MKPFICKQNMQGYERYNQMETLQCGNRNTEYKVTGYLQSSLLQNTQQPVVQNQMALPQHHWTCTICSDPHYYVNDPWWNCSNDHHQLYLCVLSHLSGHIGIGFVHHLPWMRWLLQWDTKSCHLFWLNMLQS